MAEFAIDDDLKEYLEGGVATHAGSSDPGGHPDAAIAWGCGVHADRRTVTILVNAPRSERLLGNLRDTGQIAVIFGDPVTYRAVQLKGRCLKISDPTDDDIARARKHRESFYTTTALVGDPPEAIGNLYMEDFIRIDMTVEAAFDQTPGPQAGRRL